MAAATSGPEATEPVLLALLARQRHSWEQGMTGAALRDLGRTELLEVLAQDAVARQRLDGRLAELEDVALVNSGAVGESLLALLPPDGLNGLNGLTGSAGSDGYGADGLVAAVGRQRDWLLHGCPRAADGTLFHLGDRAQMWTDTVYMVVPFLVGLGDVGAALAQLAGHRRRLRDPSSGLWAARWDEGRLALEDGRAWGTGNGWVVAALARSLQVLPPAAAESKLLAAEARDLVDACLRHRRADGLFGDVVDDPGSYRETNLAQMLAYGVLSGVADGWLPASYADTGRSLLAAASARLDPLGQVTGVPAAPGFQRPGTSPEGQAFHLLAVAASRRLEALGLAGDLPS